MRVWIKNPVLVDPRNPSGPSQSVGGYTIVKALAVIFEESAAEGTILTDGHRSCAPALVAVITEYGIHNYNLKDIYMIFYD